MISLADIKYWVRNGPENERTLPRTAVGYWLHWRTWLVVVVVTASVLVASLNISGWPAWSWGWLVAWVSFTILDTIDPKA